MADEMGDSDNGLDEGSVFIEFGSGGRKIAILSPTEGEVEGVSPYYDNTSTVAVYQGND